MWRRLVARYLGVVEAVGSNPATRTIAEARMNARCLVFMRVFFIFQFCKNVNKCHVEHQKYHIYQNYAAQKRGGYMPPLLF